MKRIWNRRLSELSLIQPMGVGGGFQFRRGPKPTLPDEVFLYGLVEFWRNSIRRGASFPSRRFRMSPDRPAASSSWTRSRSPNGWRTWRI